MSETEAYFHEVRHWRTIAANSEDEHGDEIVTDADRAKLGGVEREEVWRFRDCDAATRFAQRIGAENLHPIVDLPHRCNGFVVRVRGLVEDPSDA